MLSTGAHAAITEYAIAEKRRYTCDSLGRVDVFVRRRVQLLRVQRNDLDQPRVVQLEGRDDVRGI